MHGGQEMTTNTNATVAMISTGMVSALALAAGSAPAEAQNFDGFYGGVSAGVLFGNYIGSDGFSGDYELEQNITPGFFVGYNRTIASGLVTGVELSYQGWTGGDANDESSGQYGIASALDFRLRLGRELSNGPLGGPMLIYAFGGYTSVTPSVYYGAGMYGADSGVVYGVGVENMIGDAFSVGLELLGRTTSAYSGYYSPRETVSHYQISLRAAFHF